MIENEKKLEVNATRHVNRPGCPIDCVHLKYGSHEIEMHYEHFVDLFNLRMPAGEAVVFKVLAMPPFHIFYGNASASRG